MPILFKILIFALWLPNAMAISLTDEDLSYFDDYELKVVTKEVSSSSAYIKTIYKGSFKLKDKSIAHDQKFKDLEFIHYTQKNIGPAIIPQLTVILPNLSPIYSIDEKIAKGFADKGSDVVLLKTGITFTTYFKELKDFNRIIKEQILAAHHVLNFSLNHSEKIERVQVLGVSLGGLLAAIVLSIDSRISSGITLMAGAGYEGKTKDLGIVADVTRALQGRRKEPSPGINFDPTDLKNGYAHKKARLYMTKRDWFVPPERQNDFKNLLENPEIVFLKGMHVRNAIFSPSRVDEYFEFFNSPKNE